MTNLINVLLVALVIAGIGGGIYLVISYYTPYLVTITVKDTKVIPASGNKGSYYIVYGKEGRNIEIEWNLFYGQNRDNMLENATEHKGKPMTFNCSGWEWQAIEWYPLCGSIIKQ
jgi:hypothetical protein